MSAKTDFKKRSFGFWYNQDRAFQVLIFDGGPQETISSQIGRAAADGKRWGLIVRAILDSRFVLGKNHCENAVRRANALDKTSETDDAAGIG